MSTSASPHPNVTRVVDAAARAGLAISVREYPAGTRTAEEAAAAIGCDVVRIVKSLVFDAEGRIVLALTSGANRVDTGTLAELAGVSRLGRADADRVREVTGFPIGGVPPLGFPAPVPTFIDRSLLEHRTVWAAAGTPRHVFEVDPADLIRIADATVAHVATR